MNLTERVARAMSAKQLAMCQTTWEECGSGYKDQQLELARIAIEVIKAERDEAN